MNIVEAHKLATEAAIKAETDYKAIHGEPFYCGFAWVTLLVDGRSPLAKEIIANKIADKSSVGKGYTVWNPGKSSTQSMDVKEQGAQAYAAVMNANGFKAVAHSRAD